MKKLIIHTITVKLKTRKNYTTDMIYARIANNMKRDKLFDEENFESIYLTGKNNLEYNMAISNKT